MDQWKKRFLWLWRHCRDGFSTPESWWFDLPDEPSKEDLEKIDKWIEEE
jgi:hypothetical protein